MAEKVTCIVRGEKSKYSDCRCITEIRTDASRYNPARGPQQGQDFAGIYLRRSRGVEGEPRPRGARGPQVRPDGPERHHRGQPVEGQGLLILEIGEEIPMAHPRKPGQPKIYHGDDLTKRSSPKERSRPNKSERWDKGRRK